MRALEAAVALALAGLAGWIGFRDAGPAPEPPLAPRPDPAAPVVTEGPVREVILLPGELRAADAEVFVVPLAATWEVQLKWLIDEGTRVEPGDVIARFDPSGTQDRLDEAVNELLGKRRELELKRSEAEQTLLGLERELARAQAESDKTAIDAAIPPDVMRARDHNEKQLAHARAKRKLEDAEAALEAAKLSRSAEIFGLELDVANLEYDIERYRRQLASLELRATRPGIVVHAYHPWWGRKIREGDRLQATMRVATIPDLSTLEVEAWAAEAEVSRLAPGQKVRLALDALPRRELTGVVQRVAANGERRRQWGKAPYFRVRIALGERDEGVMRPGMSARCEVLVREVRGLPRVPVHLIARAAGRAWVQPEGGEPLPVEILAEGPLLAAVRPLQGRGLPPGAPLRPPGEPPGESAP